MKSGGRISFRRLSFLQQFSQFLDRPPLEPGDLYLRDMQDASAVLLRHPVEKPQRDHLPLPVGKRFDGAAQRHMLEPFLLGSVVTEDQL